MSGADTFVRKLGRFNAISLKSRLESVRDLAKSKPVQAIKTCLSMANEVRDVLGSNGHRYWNVCLVLANLNLQTKQFRTASKTVQIVVNLAAQRQKARAHPYTVQWLSLGQNHLSNAQYGLSNDKLAEQYLRQAIHNRRSACSWEEGQELRWMTSLQPLHPKVVRGYSTPSSKGFAGR